MASDGSVALEEPILANSPPTSPFEHENQPTFDSMVSVRLSDHQPQPTIIADDAESGSAASDATVEPDRHAQRTSTEILGGVDLDTEMKSATEIDGDMEVSSRSYIGRSDQTALSALEGSSIEDITIARRHRSQSSSSDDSVASDTVDWTELDKTEQSEVKDEESDESTAFLLARLEQENNVLATDPRFGLKHKPSKKTRPPSLHVLKKLVANPSRASIASAHFSTLPNPPPMTELEFWAAIVKDYTQTAQRLPTLTGNKIHSGVPPPLRGVVWVSMVGARDEKLGDSFDRLVLENSPYETMIGKDIGRSFPGVDMFKEAGGEGQMMLARVLKVFSLHDEEIGYCQGLGFLVGPLLMQMGDKDAFCVLVKLMEKYDLRSCFMPDLGGLHLRIFQFQRLLTTHLPQLAAHLASLSVEAAYLSQWFLSFFAVTCPLPMLFRIYDVILAEGASETIMRVALSLMRRNQSKLMALTEFEEVMQLLLSRALWETYSSNADEMVNDFVGLTGLVTRESLQNLDKMFRDTKSGTEGDSAVRAGLFTDASSAASRFLGRMWASTGTSKHAASSSTLNPNSAPAGSRPSGFLRRSPSKQSIASTVNGTDGSESNSVETAATETTAPSRVSSAEALSMTSKNPSMTMPALGAVSKEDKDLHGQIEDLLMALSDMQRDQTLLTSQLQKEREERGEDHRVFQDLLQRVKGPQSSKADRRQTAPSLEHITSTPSSLSTELGDLVERVDQRLVAHRDLRRSSMLESKQRLRESLIRSKDQLTIEVSRSHELNRRLDDQEKETANVREQLSRAQSHIQEGLKERQKLEKTVQELRYSMQWAECESPSISRTDTLNSTHRMSLSGNSTNTSNSVSASPTTPGLREFKLNRNSGGSTTGPSHSANASSSSLTTPKSNLPARGSSLSTQSILATKNHSPAEQDAMLVELVNAKTGEAVARQELEEVKARLDTLRRMLALPSQYGPTLTVSTPNHPAPGHQPTTSELNAVAAVTEAAESATPPRPKTSNVEQSNLTPPTDSAKGSAGSAGGFWSWGRRGASTANAKVPEKEDGKEKAKA